MIIAFAHTTGVGKHQTSQIPWDTYLVSLLQHVGMVRRQALFELFSVPSHDRTRHGHL